jgi:membrane associated rhomboid family serine protease
MGAYLVMFPLARMKIFFVKRIIYLPAVFYVGVWILLQVLFGLIDMGLTASDVGFFAHIGGFTVGILFAFIVKKVRTETVLAD